MELFYGNTKIMLIQIMQTRGLQWSKCVYHDTEYESVGIKQPYNACMKCCSKSVVMWCLILYVSINI